MLIHPYLLLILGGIILGGIATAAYSFHKKSKVDTDMDMFDARVATLLFELEHQGDAFK